MSVADCVQSVNRAPGQFIFRNGRRARFGFYTSACHRHARRFDSSIREHRSGFTLIELLVVIAIIAILASILFPVFSTAKVSGRKARCAEQLKQLVAASISYSDDYNSRYVPAAKDLYSDTPYGGQWRWHGWRSKLGKNFEPNKGPLWPYMGRSGGLKECPTAKYLLTVDKVS
jgi:prepilin-type N-terminal cleavage/methylation domain-containing protein